MDETLEIQKQLQKLLAEEPNNINEILKLTNKLAGLDKNNVRFSVDAGVIDRLGKELVARHETAVSELIKNAYDADATIAKLNFENVDDVGGILTVSDNGNGMTREQLVNGFMRISSSDKIHEPVSPVYKRKRAGRKGIGRFSAQRLGGKLTIKTQTASDRNALQVTIDWSKYAMDEELFLIQNKIEEVSKDKNIVSGTTLVIENLRDWWSEAMIKKVYKYALDVIQPFPISKKKIVDNKIHDVGFTIECFKDSEPIATLGSMFHEHAVAEINGFTDDKGLGYWEIENCKIDDVITNSPQIISKDDREENVPYKYLADIKIKAYYFIYNSGLIPKQVESYIRSVSNTQGGIRVYRNGFRVLPYAEPQDDWLGLDESVRKRKILAVHGNHNFFGFVEITDNNKNFIELSSREGLFNNEAYQELVDFSYKVIASAVARIASERGVKVTTDQKDWEAKYSRDPKETLLDTAQDLEDLADDLEDLVSDDENEKGTGSSGDEDSKKKEEERKKQQEKAKKIRDKAKSIREAVDHIEEFNMLRVLAGLGLIIGEFTHEIMQYLSAFKIDSKYLIDHLKESTEEYKRAVRLKETFSSFEVYASYFDETISQNVNRELKPIELRDVIKPFEKSISPDLVRNNITLDINFDGYDLFSCKMHVSEWSSILFNLYSNAKKAIKRKGTNDGKILIKVSKDDENIYVEFQDNGDGIPKENRNKIFNAFFTTSTPKGHGAEMKDELSGTGLGL